MQQDDRESEAVRWVSVSTGSRCDTECLATPYGEEEQWNEMKASFVDSSVGTWGTYLDTYVRYLERFS